MITKDFYTKQRSWCVAVIVALLTILVYLPALKNGFVNWDDDWYVYDNSYVRSFGAQSLKWMFSSFHAGNWHPLTWISHAVDYSLWELNPSGHHLTSIIFHGLNTFLVVIIITILTRRAEDKSDTSELTPHNTAVIAGAVTGILFGLHPLHVESVAWVSERKDVLYAFFFLLSVLSYIRYTEISLQRYYVLSLLFFILSLMSKPMAVTLPAVLIILDIYPLERFRVKSPFSLKDKVLYEKLPFIFLSISFSVTAILAQQAGQALRSLDSYPVSTRLFVGIRALGFYLVKMIWPTNLYPFYPYPLKISFLSLEFIGALILVLCITAFCILSWRRKKLFSVIWLYYLIALLPVLGVIQVGEQAAADRYTYLPSLGPFVLVGLGIACVCRNTDEKRPPIIKNLILFLLSVLFILMALMTVSQIKIWKDPKTLWNIEAKMNEGESFAQSGDYIKALESFNIVVMAYPEYAEGYIRRGIAYLKMDDYRNSLSDLNKALELDPHNQTASLERISAYKLAIRHYSSTISEDPGNFEAYNNRGISYAIIGRFDEAMEDFNMVISLQPEFAMAYYNRGLVYKKLGNEQKANMDFRTAAKSGDKRALN